MSKNPLDTLEADRRDEETGLEGPTERADSREQSEAETGTEVSTATEFTETGRVRTGRARGLTLVALLVVALGVLTTSAIVISLAAIPVTVLLYHRVSSLPPVSLTASRSLSKARVVPGERVTISLTVTNEGERNLPDIRIADAIPTGLRVVDGEAMGQFALGPGESATLSYTVRARRGRHEFEHVYTVCRNVSGSERHHCTLGATSRIVSGIELDTVPLASQAGRYAGRLEASQSGGGVEFFATREYHPTDSASDIDWRRYARTGEFTTIEYRDTRAASIHLLVDHRPATLLSSTDGVTLRELSLYAGEHITEALRAERHEVGLTVVGTGARTLYPDRTPEQYRRIRKQFRSDESEREGKKAEGTDALDADAADQFVEQTPSHTQFVCVTGLIDDGFDAFLDRLVKHERSILILSPQVSRPDTPGNRLLRSRRELRIEACRRQGIRVLDWETSEPLWLAIERRAGGLWE